MKQAYSEVVSTLSGPFGVLASDVFGIGRSPSASIVCPIQLACLEQPLGQIVLTSSSRVLNLDDLGSMYRSVLV
jgi:hypothetical protein